MNLNCVNCNTNLKIYYEDNFEIKYMCEKGTLTHIWLSINKQNNIINYIDCQFNDYYMANCQYLNNLTIAYSVRSESGILTGSHHNVISLEFIPLNVSEYPQCIFTLFNKLINLKAFT